MGNILVTHCHPFPRHFPPELTDIIIDFLHHDIQSLLACALVCRSWVRSSRVHLFRSCIISNPSRFGVIYHTLTTTTDVGIHVRHLTVVGEKFHGFNVGDFMTILRGLPRLHHLGLHKVTFNIRGINHTPQPHNNPIGLYTLEELQIVECGAGATKDFYSHVFRLLAMFTSIHRLFFASNSTARAPRSKCRIPRWITQQTRVAVQHLHTSDIPFCIVKLLLIVLRTSKALQTFVYDDGLALDWSAQQGGGRTWMAQQDNYITRLSPAATLPGPRPPPALRKSSRLCATRIIMLTEQRFLSHRPGTERSLAHPGLRLALASIHGVHAFHLRGRWLEPHMANIFAALPDSVSEARFVAVDFSKVNEEGTSGNRFREFAQAFAGELARRKQMTFVLDLGVAKAALEEKSFVRLRDGAEQGLSQLASRGRCQWVIEIDESLKDPRMTARRGSENRRRREWCGF
ncbi:hypothetical protein V8D89_006300 [Ganoderma adspersum]